MKKLLFAFIMSLFIFSCTEKKSTPVLEKETIQTKASELIGDCVDNGTPYSTQDHCPKTYWVTIYKDGQTPGTGKNMITVQDSSWIKFSSSKIYLDSLKYPFTANNSNYIINIDSTTGRLGVSKWTSLKIPYANITGTPASTKVDYTNTVNVSGSGGQAVFYITSDKTSTGTALYTTIDAVMPIINDVTQNYTYGWSYNSTTKALTVSAKTNLTAVITLLTVVLGPTSVTSGTPIQVLVKGH